MLGSISGVHELQREPASVCVNTRSGNRGLLELHFLLFTSSVYKVRGGLRDFASNLVFTVNTAILGGRTNGGHSIGIHLLIYHLSIYWVPGTILVALSALPNLILTMTANEGIKIHISQMQKLLQRVAAIWFS